MVAEAFIITATLSWTRPEATSEICIPVKELASGALHGASEFTETGSTRQMVPFAGKACACGTKLLGTIRNPATNSIGNSSTRVFDLIL